MRIGLYDLGCRKVRLVANLSTGGSFNTAPDSGVAEIVVGMDYESWPQVVSIVTHEALELACSEMGLRFAPLPDYSRDNGGYLFVMDHTQLSEVAGRAAWFLAKALPDLARAYKSRRRS